jgi:hypothetical protein
VLKEWTIGQVYELCRRIRDASSRHDYNVHAQWHCKQDLYRIKWAAEQALAQCKKFELEEEFIKSYEHRQLIEAIKGDDAQG